jgi:hypothetical protein
MSEVVTYIEDIEKIKNYGTNLNWYAIADSAQDDELPDRLLGNVNSVRCLFGNLQDSLVAKFSPHLIALENPRRSDLLWQWMLAKARVIPCISLVATTLSFDELFLKLTKCIEVVLPDGDEMFLAFWDPAILGTLLGQKDDNTLHVKGPVLTEPQKAMFMHGVVQWWYWDRAGGLHKIIGNNDDGIEADSRINLNQKQVDDLVEASVPDHIFYYLRANHSDLIGAISIEKRYGQIRESLMQARDIGLVSMRDILNYACADLFYGDRMRSDVKILEILERVKNKKISFDSAIRNFP